ncbi:MAG: OB-fold domain-containing protein [Actinomycetota bacterium]|mgnify:FL=1|nr:OB-fold domain-containing protein [Acidimicrobiales bacterium]MED5230565.1 OB-fold domain-containing protein [Actinomycetota bacterium]MED5446218.1 OB-fold domain-containing protein [Actinomycetota bacterium]
MTPDNPAMLTTKFWDEAKNKKLVRPVCGTCNTSFFSPQILCPWCQSGNWEFKESTGKGSIYSYTIVHRPPDDDYPNPYVIIDVELEEGWRMYSRLIDCSPSEVKIGQAVRVSFQIFKEKMLPFFKVGEE